MPLPWHPAGTLPATQATGDAQLVRIEGEVRIERLEQKGPAEVRDITES